MMDQTYNIYIADLEKARLNVTITLRHIYSQQWTVQHESHQCSLEGEEVESVGMVTAPGWTGSLERKRINLTVQS